MLLYITHASSASFLEVSLSLDDNLRIMELRREEYWAAYPITSPVKLRWRALAVRHSFHVLPGETVLEIGGGSGLWTEHLVQVLRGENEVTVAVFNPELAARAVAKNLRGAKIVSISSLEELPEGSFDYVVGTAILCHNEYARTLKAIHRLLKPGGQLYFFEANYWNPQVFLKCAVPAIGKLVGQPACQVGMRKFQLMQVASHQGFTDIYVVPYDIVHSLTPKRLIAAVHILGYALEHAPLIRNLCGTLYIWAKKPGDSKPRSTPDLTQHTELYGSTSVVIPCHNEEMNVAPIASALISMYGKYIHEIIFVDDNSTDSTSAAVNALRATDPRVRLVKRDPPGGVGRALRDGYQAATGRYILTMDCDFVTIVPEFRDLFDAIAAGYDGAIGSRFSHDSVLVNYPFMKILCNRIFHLLMNIILPVRVRDLSNNLKLYRADIFKQITIEQPHFAANVETGLKPLLAGFRIKEVPISWINRTLEMGASSFKIASVAPHYFNALVNIFLKRGTKQSAATRASAIR